MQVPIIDLALPEEDAARHVRDACTSVGFFYVRNHGVPGALLSDVFDQQRQIFGLPMEEKMKLLQDKNNRGYTPFREETLDPAHQVHGDTKEGFYFGREVPADSPEAAKPLHGPNQWPDPALLPRYREATQAYYDAMNALGMRLLRLLSLSLGLPPEHFHPMFDKPLVTLRPLHYAAQLSDPDGGVFGAGAHTDYGMLTLLVTDDVPGLQIHVAGGDEHGGAAGGTPAGGAAAADGQWVDVRPIDGTVIINLGDMLERWTNGLYRSTLHRVVNTTGRERYSIALFFEPNFDTVVEVLPQCCSAERPARYPPTTSGQHLLDKYAQTHAGYHGPARGAETTAAPQAEASAAPAAS